MTVLRLPYVVEYIDCRGKLRRYFRRKGHKLISLPGAPGSREFNAAYEDALHGKSQDDLAKSKPGTVSALIAGYYASPSFKGLKDISRATYRNYIEPIRREFGDDKVAHFERKHIKAIVGKCETPGTANNVLAAWRRLMAFAVDAEIRDDDPTVGIKKLRTKEGGFVAWSDDDIAQFESVHPVGSRARLAMALLLFTAQRRSDAVGMGWQHVSRDRISVRQSKTGERLQIPIHPELARILADTPRENLTFLMTDYGKPFSPTGFSMWFGDRCREAGLGLGYNAHGLRKAAARRLAEAGCSTKQIQAITGHRTLSEVARYTDAADQIGLADAAIKRLK